jgi:hypothetical protein
MSMRKVELDSPYWQFLGEGSCSLALECEETFHIHTRDNSSAPSSNEPTYITVRGKPRGRNFTDNHVQLPGGFVWIRMIPRKGRFTFIPGQNFDGNGSTNNGQRLNLEYIVTQSGQQTITLPHNNPTKVDVFNNGLKQYNDDAGITIDGSSVILSASFGIQDGDMITIEYELLSY